MRKIATIITITEIFLFLATSVVTADDNATINIVRPDDIVKITDLGALIGSVVGVLLILAALAAFLYLLIGGFQWITSGGDKAKVENAQHRIQAAIIGLIIVFAVWALFALIGNYLGIDIFKMTLPKPY